MISRIAICGLVAAAALSVNVDAASAKGKCARYAGEGLAVTHELATINAKDQLAQAITAAGAKAKGKVAVTCKYELVASSCKAAQRACK